MDIQIVMHLCISILFSAKRNKKDTLGRRNDENQKWARKLNTTMEYYSAIRNDKYPPFASTWMELEGMMQ